MEDLHTFAFGVELSLATTEAGGRRTALTGGHGPERRFQYRPQWGLPGVPSPGNSDAPVLGFARTNIEPGEIVQAIIVPIFEASLATWARVGPGDELPMYEGPRVYGVGRILWRDNLIYPVADADEALLLARLDMT